MKNRYLHTLIVLFLPLFAFAQDITGSVFDSSDTPIIGAYILDITSKQHAHTNELGNFQLKGVQLGDTLQIVYLGFKTQELIIDDLSKEFAIEMKESTFDLDEIVVGQNAKTINLISDIDMKLNPVKSSQEILAKVPGLFIGQHAGGGKAEQIFLRGFDIDHGTDVTLTVDGMPVNMVSHAHGQGYADLHFVIPETVDFIDYGKGPYYADQGNFNTAGYVSMKTKDRLDNSLVKFEAGQFNTFRTVGLLDVLKTDHHNAYIATEYMLTDGPVESPQNFHRANVMLKYTGSLANENRISVIASHFDSKWDASGQIPQRAVDSGQITRWGSIDDTEGGQTSRTNLAVDFTRNLNTTTFVRNRVYYSRYDFELFSNFTFFLDDPENSDQIQQREERQIFGAESSWNHSLFIGDNISTLLQAGVGLRHDNIDGNMLGHTLNRKTMLEYYALGNVDETNMYAFTNVELDFGKLLIQPGLRLDFFKFNYVDEMQTQFDRQAAQQAMLSPKLNAVYNINRAAQIFVKAGTGFHSNDTRVVVTEQDKETLPAAYGADLGTILKPTKRLIINAAAWYLFLEQEFVYVGDAGVVEPSGRTERKGVDVGMRWQLMDGLFVYSDLNYAIPRSLDDGEGENFIPLAPTLTSTGGINYQNNGFSAGARYRYIKDRPANEDNSIVAKGYFITDINANYEWKRINIGFSIDNLFNQEWNEAQFATESRLQFETESVEEIHFTPGTPFFIKGNISYKF